jgi:hypothetical protein
LPPLPTKASTKAAIATAAVIAATMTDTTATATTTALTLAVTVLSKNMKISKLWRLSILFEKIRLWIPAFLTHILRFCQEGGVYKRYFWVSVSSETCAPGGSYFVYSVFLGVMLAQSMQSPESLFLTCNSFTSFSVLILLNHDEKGSGPHG